MFPKTVLIDAEKCSGCRACEVFCALNHFGECTPSKARIHIVKWEMAGVFVPVSCHRCERPACQLICPTGATYRDPLTGALLVDDARCLGCYSCVGACPFGATMVDADTGRVLKCDLCGGDPICVKVCPTAALRYEPLGQETHAKVVANAVRLGELVQAVMANGNGR